jgi:hypothetical protein
MKILVSNHQDEASFALDFFSKLFDTLVEYDEVNDQYVILEKDLINLNVFEAAIGKKRSKA